jgi:glycosyltransferase involved in cell wall biosynthesis
MRVAVVTPYFKEPRAWLQRCIDSVRAQTLACEHLLIADGHAQDWLDDTGVRHLRLDRCHADYGNTPRSVGAQLMVSEGFDAVAFLDADNAFDPGHVASCVDRAEATGADYVAARRRFVREDGSELPYRSREDESGAHVDTSCLFLLFGAFHALPRWGLMPKPMSILGDRYFLRSLREEGLREARLDQPTVSYQCGFADVYRAVGETPPAFAKDGLPVDRLSQWLRRLQPDDFVQVARLSGCRMQADRDIATAHSA